MRYDQLSPVPPLTKMTKGLIIACVVMYFVDFVLYHLGVKFWDLNLNDILGLVPGLVKTKYWVWQFVTYIFMHGHPLHLLLNMLILWYFGAEIEQKMGEYTFLAYFFMCGIGAGLFNFAINIAFNDVAHLSHPIIGASGAIFGVLAAYGVFFGERYFLVFFLFPMKAKYFVLVIAGIELVMGVEAGAQDNVAHFAHIGGMLIGATYLYFKYIRPSRGSGNGSRRDAERERLRKQFTLIVNQGGGKDGGNKDDKGPYWN